MNQPLSKPLSHIIEGCLKGDRLSQKLLYERFYSKMMNICLRYSSDHETASQLLNSGFLSVFENLKSLKETASFEGWAKKIMINKCIDHIRSQSTSQISKIQVEKSDLLINPEYFDRISADEIMGFIQKLPPKTRAVFNLFAIEGYSHNEIATMLDISINTSAWHVNQARTLLKEMINNAK